MKLTNYLINEDFINVDQIISDNKILKPFTLILGITVAIFGVTVIAGALPFAAAVDSTRYFRYTYLIFLRKYRRYSYYDDVFVSLAIKSPKREKLHLAIKDITYYDIIVGKRLKVTPELILHKGVDNIRNIKEKLTFF